MNEAYRDDLNFVALPSKHIATLTRVAISSKDIAMTPIGVVISSNYIAMTSTAL